LREHRRRQAAERLAFGPQYANRGLVFTQEDGSPLVPRIFTQRFQKASRDAGLPQIRFHDLRHGHVTYLMQAGVPLPAIAQRVGHSSVAVTGDIYSHVVSEMRADTAAAAAAAVFGD
jgi:integrase